MTAGGDCGTVRAMPSPAEKPLAVVERFDEKEFYLDEFRGHTLLFSIPVEELAQDPDYERVGGVVRELLTNDTRVLVLVGVPDDTRAEQILRRLQRRLGALIFREETIPLFPQRGARSGAFNVLDAAAMAAPAAATALLATVWNTLRRGPLFVGVITSATRAMATGFAQQVATRLRVHKLILVEPEGGVTGTDGKQLSFMDETLLATLLAAGQAEWAGMAARRATFEAIRGALVGGVTSVNLCALAGVARELFTYEGSGTLFTLQDYCTVQPLGIDDYEEVERLIERGQREGLLKLRSADEVAAMLVNGYGATIGAHHLSGICALIADAYTRDRAGELVGLYTITRFKGEGVGGRLVARVLADARAAGLAYVFACTTEERAQVFFERQGFRRVGPEAVPAAKWESYDPHRKAQLAVFRFDLASAGG
jgi:N-acetylglutamate synthase-like GNAT family acetyltransferase